MPALLHDTLLTSAEMRAIFDDRASLQAMLDFEAALARAEAASGLIPDAAAEAIARCCRAELYDAAVIATEAARAGALGIALVRHLTRRVGEEDPAATGFVHFGSTSQDVADTGLVLQMRAGCRLLERDLGQLANALGALAEARRGATMLGRTLLQPGPPVTLGLKAASWLVAVVDGGERLVRERQGALLLQFGGPVGTLSALGAHGAGVAAELGRLLDLPVPPLPWHTRRDGIAGLACALGILAGSLGKMGRDIALMMQFELGEVAEPGGKGRGGSSAMPHKRNPVASMIALGAATRAPGLVSALLSGMSQELERGLGGWQAEPFALAALFECVHGAVQAMLEAVGGLLVDEPAMAANIEALDGLIFAERLLGALAPALGRGEAHRLVEELVGKAIAGRSHLRQVAQATPAVLAHLSPEAIAALFVARDYLGSNDTFIDAALARLRQQGPG